MGTLQQCTSVKTLIRSASGGIRGHATIITSRHVNCSSEFAAIIQHCVLKLKVLFLFCYNYLDIFLNFYFHLIVHSLFACIVRFNTIILPACLACYIEYYRSVVVTARNRICYAQIVYVGISAIVSHWGLVIPSSREAK